MPGRRRARTRRFQTERVPSASTVTRVLRDVADRGLLPKRRFGSLSGRDVLERELQ